MSQGLGIYKYTSTALRRSRRFACRSIGAGKIFFALRYICITGLLHYVKGTCALVTWCLISCTPDKDI